MARSESSREGLERGPRGRRLCWTVLDRLHPDSVSSPFWRAHSRPDSAGLLGVLGSSLPAVDLGGLTDLSSEQLLLECAADAVDSARYWQDPDELDVALGDPRLVTALAPVAAQIVAAPAAAWWPTGLDLAQQVYVEKRYEGVIRSPRFRGAQIVLEGWREQTTGPGAKHRGQWVGGPWWSTPQWSVLAKDLERYGEDPPKVAETTRSRPGLGAVGLLLEEDTFGAPTALCWPVEASKSVRAFEIDGPGDWLELVERYGVDVTGKRIAHWSMATGLDCRWTMPDWSAVARDYDVVHLTLHGYFTTSGRPLPVAEESSTFLAGWDPDTSYWLSDVLEVVGQPTEWIAGPSRQWRSGQDAAP